MVTAASAEEITAKQAGTEQAEEAKRKPHCGSLLVVEERRSCKPRG